MCLFSLLVVFTGCFAWFVSIRNHNSDSNNMPIVKAKTAITKISLHEYYGESTLEDGKTYFGFNPTSTSEITITNGVPSGGSSIPLELGPYSVDDPNHPVLLLMEVNGGIELLEARTNYTYLAQDEITTDYTVATYSALGTYSNGEKIKITADETCNGSSTIYEYVVPTSGDPYFKMLWIELKEEHNPLSSVVQFHSFTFTSAPVASTHSLYTYDENWIKSNEPTSMSCLAFDKSEFTDENGSSFTQFQNFGEYQGFETDIAIFAGSLAGCTHLAIVIDYFPPAMEYLFFYYLGHEYLNDGLSFDCDWETYI